MSTGYVISKTKIFNSLAILFSNKICIWMIVFCHPDYLCCLILKALFSDLQLRHVQSVAKEKFGPLAGRVFKLLIVNKSLEETQVNITNWDKQIRLLTCFVFCNFVNPS